MRWWIGSIKVALLFCFLITAAMQDVLAGRVANRLIAAGLVTGLVFQVTEHGVYGIYYFLGNISVPVVLFYLLFQMRALGAGDIKLFSMTGSILTIGKLFQCMAYSFLAAGVFAAFLLAADYNRRRTLAYAAEYLLDVLCTKKLKPYTVLDEEARAPFAFAVPVFFGTAAALLFP